MMLTATLMIRRLKKDILAQLPEKQRRIQKVDVLDPLKRADMKQMLALATQYEDMVTKHKKTAAGDVANRERNAVELAELKQRKKHVLMALFTKSGEAKLPAILKHLDAFLDNPLSGKVIIIDQFLIFNSHMNFNIDVNLVIF